MDCQHLKNGLKTIFQLYEIFLIDLWGVVHDGIRLNPLAMEVLQNLKKNNKEFFLISNAPRPRDSVGKFLKKLNIDNEKDTIYCKKMPSAFFETQLQSLCVWHEVDTVIMTGGSTSGCIRATAVDSLSRGYRTIVPEECVADKHESYHFANLTDLSIKYADVLDVQEVFDWLDK